MTPPTVVLISGKAGSGKDQLADTLRVVLSIEYGAVVHVLHYADVLKYILQSYSYWDGVKDIEGRTLLQTVGDSFRVSNENFFVDFAINVIQSIKQDVDVILIPDTRFRNEIEKMKSVFQIVTVRVNRDDLSDQSGSWRGHVSENELDNFPFDFFIENKTLEGLENDARILASQIVERM